MKKIISVNKDNLEDIAIGGAVLGSGGGGDPYVGKLMTNQCLETAHPVKVIQVETLNDDEWPVHIDLNNDILLTAGVGNSSYPRSVRIWDLNKMRKSTPNISYNGAIYASRFMDSGKIIAAVDNDNYFRAWDTLTGKPSIDPVKHIYNVALSNNGYYAHKRGESLFLSRIPIAIEKSPKILPDFIPNPMKHWLPGLRIMALN